MGTRALEAPRRGDRWAGLASAAGLTRALELFARRPCLLVIGWHRIGDARSCEWDAGLFSATAEALYEQIRYLRSRYRVASLDEAIEACEKGIREPSVLFTFDDGYVDNYSMAFPILRDLSVPAAFFLPTAFIGASHVPWWDAIASILRHARSRLLHPSYPAGLTIDLSAGLGAAIRQATSAYKMVGVTDPKVFLDALAEAAGAEVPASADPALFMTWEQARQMVAGGMALGSHTHSHPVLSALGAEAQYDELHRSKNEIRRHTGYDPQALAFPVGKKHSINSATRDAVKQAGYRAAFSFYGGINRPGRMDAFDLRRIDADGFRSLGVMRLQISRAIAGGLPA